MVLLVVGLVAVIVVILTAALLSMRLGRDGDDDEQLSEAAAERDWHGDSKRRQYEEPAPSRRGAATWAGNGDQDRELVSAQSARGASRAVAAGQTGPQRASGPYGAPGGHDMASGQNDVAPRGRAEARRGPRRTVASDEFPSGEIPAADHPSMEFPAVDYEADGYPPEKTGPRRKQSKSASQESPKARSRSARGKRDDDNDWPSGDWGDLSDEDYWAELSADKPLATMARTAKPTKRPASQPAQPAAPPARAARPPAAAPGADDLGRTPARPLPARKPRPQAEPAPTGGYPAQAPAARQRDREVGSREVGSRAVPQREPATERFAAPVRAAASGRASASERPSAERMPAAERPAADHGTSVTERLPLPARSRQHPRQSGLRGEELPAAAAAISGARPSGARPAPQGRLDDDPLTDPSFAWTAAAVTDSRSYSNARRPRPALPAPPGQGAPRDREQDTGGQRASTSYGTSRPENASFGAGRNGNASYGDTGRPSYSGPLPAAAPAPPAAPSPGSAPPAARRGPAEARRGRHEGSGGHTPAQGNPYGGPAAPNRTDSNRTDSYSTGELAALYSPAPLPTSQSARRTSPNGAPGGPAPYYGQGYPDPLSAPLPAPPAPAPHGQQFPPQSYADPQAPAGAAYPDPMGSSAYAVGYPGQDPYGNGQGSQPYTENYQGGYGSQGHGGGYEDGVPGDSYGDSGHNGYPAHG